MMVRTRAVKVICVAGARPNFMKLAPLLRLLREHPGFRAVLVHTGQHYDDMMSGQFFADLGLPTQDFNLEVGSGSHAQQTAEIMKRFEPVAISESPAAVLVVGDVNSTMACALVAAKLQIPVSRAL
jgi:UDP-N-acetylglucosamine 2-epimerase (non-hydrolysing)